MRLPTHSSIVFLCVVIACAAHGATSQTQIDKKEPSGSVSGKVTIKGKPAAGIVVGMQLAQPDLFSPSYKATTNEEGAYRITNIPKGTYRVAPAAPAMVIAKSADPGDSVLIIDGDNGVGGMDFDLVPGGVVTGKVTDANGPLVGMEVMLSPVAQPNQPSGYYQGPEGQTDDRGIYRLFGVRAGRYKISVVSNGGFGSGRVPLPLTFYPDTQDANKAGTVDVDEGSETSNVDIRIGPPPRTFTVSGRVIESENGKPVPNMFVYLIHQDNSHVRTDSQGQFKLRNVTSGKYQLQIDSNEEGDLRSRQPTEFEVSDSDVTGLIIKTVRTAEVSGIVVFEGNRKDLASQFYVVMYSDDRSRRMIWESSGPVKSDFSFTINGVRPGTFVLSVGGQESGARILRVERDGVVQPNSFQIEGAEHITGLRLVVAVSSGSISGAVKTINGSLPADAHLYVEARRTDETTPNMGVGGQQVDARSHFLFEGLAAGTYQVTVIVNAPNARPRMLTAKEIVTVTDGAVSDVTLTLDLSQSPNP